MRNDMGNQNTNGLQVSEQEIEEASKVISQSPNASFVSNDLDGLKGLTGYLSSSSLTSEKPENEKLDTNGYLEPAVDMGQSISLRKNEDFATEEPLKSSIVSNDALDQAFENQDYDKLATSETLDSLIMSNEEHTDFVKDESSEADDSLIQKQISERREKHEVEKLDIKKHEVEKLDIDEYLEHVDVSNDTEEQSQLTLSIVYEDIHDEQTNSAQGSLETDDALIQNQMSEEREKHEVEKLDFSEHLEHVDVSSHTEEQSQLTLSRVHEDIHDAQIHSAHRSSEADDALIQKQMSEERVEEAAKIWAQESTEKGGGLEDRIVERPKECVIADTNQENTMKEFPVEDIDSRGEMVLMNRSEVVIGSVDQDGDRQCAEADAVDKDFGPLEWKNLMSNEPIITYLDDIDLEIEKLVMEDDENEVTEASKTESNGYEDMLNHPLEELNMDDIDTDSFEIQLKAIDSCKEERQEDSGLEEAVFEIAIQNDYNPSLMSEKQRKDLGGDTKSVDMETATVTAISAVDKKYEERIEYETGGLENNEIIGEFFPQFSSCLSDPVMAMVMETEDSNAEKIGFVRKVSEREAIRLENTEIMEKKTEALNVMDSTAERDSEEQNGEFEKKCVAKEEETPTSKEGSIAIGVSEDDSIFAEIPVLTGNTFFLSAFESGSGRQLQDSITPLEQHTMTHNKEVECVQSDQTFVCVSATSPKNLEGSGRLTIELSQEKYMDEADDNALESVKCLIYTSERSDLEAKESSPSYISAQEYGSDESEEIPSVGNDKATKDAAFAFENSETEENVSEYHVSTNQELISKAGAYTSVSVLESTYEESDNSQLLCRKSEESEVCAMELSDSRKLKAPLGNFLKVEGTVVESVDKNNGVVLKKTSQDLWQSPAKKSMASSAGSREKQKPRSSLFSSCMCCTTAIN